MDPLLPCGQAAPNFSLYDLNNQLHSLRDYQGRITVMNFWSAECPWVERTDREIQLRLSRWAPEVVFLYIASNQNESMDLLQTTSKERGLPVVLRDTHQNVANLYGAQTTPHFFVIDSTGILRYQGAFDDVSFRKRTPSIQYLDEAVEALLAGRPPNPEYTLPYGCAIVKYS
jgi:peroxiredoxin